MGAGVGIAAAGTGIDDEIAIVAIVLVPARYDDRVGALATATGDPVLIRRVHRCGRAPIGIRGAFGVSGYLAETSSP